MQNTLDSIRLGLQCDVVLIE